MTVKEAKKILPKNEFEAFESILLNQTGKMGSSVLMQKATLSRKLRDKYRDLSRHQALGARTRRTNEIDTDLNDRKSRIFQQLMNQIEDILEEQKSSGTFKSAKLSNSQSRKKARRVVSHEATADEKRTLLEARRRSRSESI